MTVYILTLVILMFYGVSSNHNRTDRRKKRYIFIAFGCITIISMLRNYTVGRDLAGHYYNSFFRIANTDWKNLYTLSYENGYLIFNKLVSLFTHDGQWMIAVHALFVIGVTGWFVYKNSENVVMSTFLFIATNTWFMYMTMLRQAMAVSVVLLGVEFLKRRELGIRRIIIYCLFVLLAMQFHNSAVVAFAIPVFDFLPFKRKQIFLSSVAMIASLVLYNQLFQLISLFNFDKRDYTEFYSESGSAINIISLYFVFIYVVIFAIGALELVYFNRKRGSDINEASMSDYYSDSGLKDSFLLYMVLMLVICRLTGLRISIMSRMTYYFLPFVFILLPRSVNRIHNSSNKKIIKLGLYSLMLLAFLWLGFRSVANLYGTVPYVPFWK